MFKKGQSGNPKGRPKGTGGIDWCREFCETEGKELLMKWAKSKNPKASMQALTLIHAYGYGRPTENHNVNGRLTLEQLLSESRE